LQLGTATDVSIDELVQMVGEILGNELTVETDPARVRPARSEVERLISDPALAAELAGWQPAVDLREGVARTIEWIERHAGRFRVGEYAI
jgi:nucleoside-diphosphate-sugar epimerase